MDGRPPKDDGRKANKAPMTFEWIDVPRVPYEGPVPEMPYGLCIESQRFFKVITRMPHCILYEKDDWERVIQCTLLHDRFITQGKVGQFGELLRLQDLLGVGWTARRQQRIRYVDPDTHKPVETQDANPDEVEERLLRLVSDA